MAASDFQALLLRPANGFKKPPSLPQGTFLGRITGHKMDESRQKKTLFVRYDVRILGPGADVDPSEIEGIDFSKKTLPKDFYMTEDAIHRFTTFAKSCGIDVNRALKAVIPDIIGSDVTLQIGRRPSEEKNPDGSPKDWYNDILDITGNVEVTE